jgi:hypothetical protein
MLVIYQPDLLHDIVFDTGEDPGSTTYTDVQRRMKFLVQDFNLWAETLQYLIRSSDCRLCHTVLPSS